MTAQTSTIPGNNDEGMNLDLVEEQLAAFKRDGCVIIENALSEQKLNPVLTAFDKVQAHARVDWEMGKANGVGVSANGEYFASGTWHARKYFDIYPLHLLEKEDAAIDIIANPRLFPFLKSAVGNDVQAATIQLRVLESQTTEDAEAEGGYVKWHRDHSSDEDWRYCGHPLNVKVIFYLTDVGPNDGCTAFVPGSHLFEDMPDYSKYKGMGGGDDNRTNALDQRDMPGMVAAEVKAGSAFLFDTRLWHTTLPNTGDHDRWCVITLYCPFFQKQPGVTVEAAMALKKTGHLSTPMRRQLFGLQPMSGRNVFKRLADHNGDDVDDRMFKGVRPPNRPLSGTSPHPQSS